MPEYHSPDDPFPGLLAALDQLKAGLPLIAEASWAIYSAYREVGFTEQQAFQVVHLHVMSLFAAVADDE